LFSRTIRENILLGASADGANEAERLEAVLDLADLRKDLEQLPNGLDTMAGEKGIALSGGQKQRICIARALFKDPDILILDDALSAVDTETEAAILNRLRLDRAGKTTLISAHRLSCVLSADLILVMEDGRIVAQGSHETLLNDNPWYREQCCHQQAEGRSDHGV
jgi:ATP-binding cassette subfamily B protein